MSYRLIRPETPTTPAEYSPEPGDPVECALCRQLWDRDADWNPRPTLHHQDGWAEGPDGGIYCAERCLEQAELAWLRAQTGREIIPALSEVAKLAAGLSRQARESDDAQEDAPAAVLDYALGSLAAYAANRDSGFRSNPVVLSRTEAASVSTGLKCATGAIAHARRSLVQNPVEQTLLEREASIVTEAAAALDAALLRS